MLNSDFLMSAMNGVHEEQVVLAGDFLGYIEGAPARRGYGRIGRIVLVAAVIASLFSVTAYALNWFGLQARLTMSQEHIVSGEEVSDTVEVGYLSINAYGDTPAGQAHMAWTQFWWDYTAAKDAEAEAAGLPYYDWDANAWEPEDEELRNISRIYAAFDQTMLDKLLEIRDTYGVRLHTARWTPRTEEDFFRVTGAEPFLREEPSHSVCEYVYDDGSFKFSALSDWYSINLLRGTLGALDPSANTVRPEEYEQWQCATSLGNLVDIAWRAHTDGSGSGFMFYHEGDYLITVLFSVVDREHVEALAGLIDFSAACRGDWEAAQAALEEAMRNDTVLPEAAWTDSGITLEAFFQTPEYRAMDEFHTLYTEHMGLPYEADGFMGVYGHPYGALTQEEFDAQAAISREIGVSIFWRHGDDSTDADILAVCEKYGLVYPKYKEFIAGKAVPYGYDGGYTYRSPARSITEEDILQMLGQGSTGDSLPIQGMQNAVIDWYDTGAFQADAMIENQVTYCLHYIPKGTLYTCLGTLGNAADYADVRTVETACGANVCLATGNPYLHQGNLILYESPNAYVIVQSADWRYLLDAMDFTRFK